MKSLTTVLLLCALFLLINFASAAPVLIAVDLNGPDQIREWHVLEYPTYEFIGKTAIAEIDDAHVVRLTEMGFSIEVIDVSPWTENYFIGSVPQPNTELPGRVILQRNNVRLVKSATARISDFMDLRLKFRPLKKRVLSERFWENMTVKKVPLRDLEYDPFIQSLVDQVRTDSLRSYTQRLQDFQTRLLFSDSGFASSEWIRQKFNGLGYAAEFDSFYIEATNYGTWPDTGYERNVVARIQGTVHPTRFFLISGHHDGIIWPDTNNAWAYAPGADDNASAVAAIFEAARIFHNYSWESSIEFITWAAEEVGLLGSDDYAHRADSLDLDIEAVINMDMIGWTDGGLLNCNLHYTYDHCLWLVYLVAQAGQLYAPELTYFEEYFAGGSDDLSFSSRGFPATWVAERWYFLNPNWHTTTDIVANITPAMHLGAAKAAVATLAILGLHPAPVSDVTVNDFGDGSNLQVSWSPNIEPDVTGYRVYWGLTSEVYTDSHFVSGISTTADTLSGLLTDSTYYITVRALDVDNRLSCLATEVTGTPGVVPAAPTGVVATPIQSGIEITWLGNTELDFAGYRLYRRLNDDPTYDSLNTALMTDTTYTDHPLSGANRYYYAVRAFDLTGNFSVLSAEAYGRPITMDQGIIIVDETFNGTNPPDSLQDAFYRYIMDDYQYDEYEFGYLSQKPAFADFVPYSSVLWHADDLNSYHAWRCREEFRDYLDL
ncbi:MAG: M20/M25/M40 family metallo-hydrolase, partial [candidate division WOR-3 bacterium]